MYASACVLTRVCTRVDFSLSLCVCVYMCACLPAPRLWAQVVDMAKAPLRLKGAKKNGATPLTRPLLCICNDPFAPHLRALREVTVFVCFVCLK